MSANFVLYKPGQIVKHTGYFYRGVIVKIDEEFKASHAWYEAHQMKVAKEQPWYHMLLSEINQVGYAAQSDLIPDESCQKIEHPLVPIFFHPFQDGHYLRNNRPWPNNDFM